MKTTCVIEVLKVDGVSGKEGEASTKGNGGLTLERGGLNKDGKVLIELKPSLVEGASIMWVRLDDLIDASKALNTERHYIGL